MKKAPTPSRQDESIYEKSILYRAKFTIVQLVLLAVIPYTINAILNMIDIITREGNGALLNSSTYSRVLLIDKLSDPINQVPWLVIAVFAVVIYVAASIWRERRMILRWSSTGGDEVFQERIRRLKQIDVNYGEESDTIPV